MLLTLLLLAFQASPEALELLRAHKPREAAVRMEQELLADPQNDGLRQSLVACELHLKAFAKALSHMPTEDAAYAPSRGRALFALGRFEEALTWLDPADPELTLMAAEALEALGRMDELDRATGQAAQALGADHPAVLVLQGRALARRGQYVEAARRFQEARARDPWDAAALFALGRALVRSGEREQGLALLQEHRRLVPLLDELEFALASLALDPSHAPNHAALGDAERKLGRFEQARAAYQVGLQLADGEQAVPIALRFERFLREDGADPAAALEVLRATRQRFDHVRLWVREGDVLAAMDRMEEARSAWLQAAERLPGDPSIQQRLQSGGGRGE